MRRLVIALCAVLLLGAGSAGTVSAAPFSGVITLPGSHLGRGHRARRRIDVLRRRPVHRRHLPWRHPCRVGVAVHRCAGGPHGGRDEVRPRAPSAVRRRRVHRPGLRLRHTDGRERGRIPVRRSRRRTDHGQRRGRHPRRRLVHRFDAAEPLSRADRAAWIAWCSLHPGRPGTRREPLGGVQPQRHRRDRERQDPDRVAQRRRDPVHDQPDDGSQRRDRRREPPQRRRDHLRGRQTMGRPELQQPGHGAASGPRPLDGAGRPSHHAMARSRYRPP